MPKGSRLIFGLAGCSNGNQEKNNNSKTEQKHEDVLAKIEEIFDVQWFQKLKEIRFPYLPKIFKLMLNSNNRDWPFCIDFGIFLLWWARPGRFFSWINNLRLFTSFFVRLIFTKTKILVIFWNSWWFVKKLCIRISHQNLSECNFQYYQNYTFVHWYFAFRKKSAIGINTQRYIAG